MSELDPRACNLRRVLAGARCADVRYYPFRIKLGTCVPEQRAPASVASDAGARCADVRLYPFGIKLGTCVPEQRAPASVASDAGARCADVRLYPFRIKLGTCVPEQRAPASVASDAGARCAVRLYPFRIKLGTCVPEQRAPASVASDMWWHIKFDLHGSAQWFVKSNFQSESSFSKSEKAKISIYLIQNLISMDIGPRREKTCLRGFANNKSANQPGHPRDLNSAFDVRFMIAKYHI